MSKETGMPLVVGPSSPPSDAGNPNTPPPGTPNGGGAVIGGELFRLFRIDFGLGELKVTFEDLIAAFLGSLIVIFAWRIIARTGVKDAGKNRPKPMP